MAFWGYKQQTEKECGPAEGALPSEAFCVLTEGRGRGGGKRHSFFKHSFLPLTKDAHYVAVHDREVVYNNSRGK